MKMMQKILMFIQTGFFFFFFYAGYNLFASFFWQSDTITVWKTAQRYKLIVPTNRPHVLYAEYYYIILFFIQCNYCLENSKKIKTCKIIRHK